MPVTLISSYTGVFCLFPFPPEVNMMLLKIHILAVAGGENKYLKYPQ